MQTIDRLYILCNEKPQRRYRQIAAISEEGPFQIQFYAGICEGEAPQERSFDLGNPDAALVFCATKSEAISRADNEHTSSLNNGWHDYRKE
jgi:hypothetical protein